MPRGRVVTPSTSWMPHVARGRFRTGRDIRRPSISIGPPGASPTSARASPRPWPHALTRYTEALEQLRALRDPVTAFFDTILVMADDVTLRHARLALLDSVAALIRVVGDLTKIQLES